MPDTTCVMTDTPVRITGFQPVNASIERLPLTAYDLIDFLAECYPARCKAPGEDLEAHLHYAGARAMIDELLEVKTGEIEGYDDERDAPSDDPRRVEPRQLEATTDLD